MDSRVESGEGCVCGGIEATRGEGEGDGITAGVANPEVEILHRYAGVDLERFAAVQQCGRVDPRLVGEVAIEILEGSDEEERPDVLVSDIGLPDMDGMELIKNVRERPAIARIPAVALTAYASRQDATKAITAGFDAHVAKPVQPATLGRVLMRLLASSRLASSAA